MSDAQAAGTAPAFTLHNPEPAGDQLYGATYDEWALWYRLAPNDLLTSVPNHFHYEASGEALKHQEAYNLDPSGKELGFSAKVPSKIDHTGKLTFIAGYYKKPPASEAQVVSWARERRYNVSLVTRTIAAIDIDIEDQAVVDKVVKHFTDNLGPLPRRWRANSARVMLFVRIEGGVNFGLAVLKRNGVAKQQVEIRGQNCQAVVTGTHASGYRMRLAGFENGIPTVDAKHFENVVNVLAAAFVSPADYAAYGTLTTAGKVKERPAPSTIQIASDDPVVAHLHAQGMVREHASDGKVHITCPWADEHGDSDSISGTSYMPRGYGSNQDGYSCLHAHCRGRNTIDFLRKIGLQPDIDTPPDTAPFAAGLVAVSAPPPAMPLALTPAKTLALGKLRALQARDTERRVAPGGCTLEDMFEMAFRSASDETVNDVRPGAVPIGMTGVKIKGKFDGRRDCIRWFLDSPSGFVFLHCGFTDRPGVLFAAEEQPRWLASPDDALVAVSIALHRVTNVHPHAEELKLALKLVRESAAASAAKGESPFDTAKNYIEALEWDGVRRIDTFDRDVLRVANPDSYTSAAVRYFFLSYAARLANPAGIKADAMLVLLSEAEGTGKSTLVQALAIPEDGRPATQKTISLSAKKDDILRLMVGASVVEIGELEGMDGTSIEQTKNFLSSTTDSLVPKYANTKQEFPRRAVVVGTTNKTEHLYGDGDQRRFFTLTLSPDAGGRYMQKHQLRSSMAAEARDQCLAEALHDLNAAASHQDAVIAAYNTTLALAKPTQRKHRVRNPMEGNILGVVGVQPVGTVLSISKIFAMLQIHPSRITQTLQRWVTETMNANGFERGPSSNTWIAGTAKYLDSVEPAQSVAERRAVHHPGFAATSSLQKPH